MNSSFLLIRPAGYHCLLWHNFNLASKLSRCTFLLAARGMASWKALSKKSSQFDPMQVRVPGLVAAPFGSPWYIQGSINSGEFFSKRKYKTKRKSSLEKLAGRLNTQEEWKRLEMGIESAPAAATLNLSTPVRPVTKNRDVRNHHNSWRLLETTFWVQEQTTSRL
ncbi:hypothetical protein BDZ91DRAFT_711519 [Kalaharituber pfeilii]|nr:hypothetical protein BDZ91DRAFT_711519 [Kalaharituber pfeilii]